MRFRSISLVLIGALAAAAGLVMQQPARAQTATCSPLAPAPTTTSGGLLSSAANGDSRQSVQFRPIYDVNADYLRCWLAASSNALGAAGWGVNADGTRPASAQTIYDTMNPLFPANTTGFVSNAFRKYFDLHKTNWGYAPSSPYSDWATPYTAGLDTGGLPDNGRWYDDMPGTVRGWLGTGYAVGATVDLTLMGPGWGGHSINVFGYEQDAAGTVTRLIISDNGDGVNGTQTVSLRRDPSGFLYLDDYVRPDGVKTGIPLELIWGVRQARPTFDMTVSTVGDLPVVSAELAAYLKTFYDSATPETGITDAPLVAFNGVPLSAASTGWDFLRYTAGDAVGDKISGNGIDELVPVSFSFPALPIITSAQLVLNLTPRDSLVTTDLLMFADNASTQAMNIGNSILDDLLVDTGAIVTFDLAAIPTAAGPLSLLSALQDGDFGFFYGDDAILRGATLIIRGALPEPGTLSLLLACLAGLAGGRRRVAGER